MIESQKAFPRRRRGRPGLLGWAVVASDVRSELAARGIAAPTASDLESAAKKLELKASTLLRYLGVSGFVDNIAQRAETSALGAGLRLAAVSAVELIMRWYKYDEVAALAAAERLVTGEYTIEMLRKDERAAHLATTKVVSLRTYRAQLRKRLTIWAIKLLDDSFEIKAAGRFDPAVDVLLVSKLQAEKRSGLVVLDPFPARGRGDRLAEFLTLVAGAAGWLEKIVAVIPRNFVEQYAGWIESNPLPPNVFVYEIRAGTYLDLLPRRLATG